MFFKRCIVCVCLLAFCFAAKTLPGEKSNIVQKSIKYIVTESTDIKKEAAKIISYFKKDESLDTLSPVSGLGSPAKDAIVTKRFGIQDAGAGDFNYGVYIKTKSNESIVSANSGKVTEIAKDEKKGTYIIISHSKDITTLYASLGEIIINTGDKVAKGQAIAKPEKDNTFYFELKRNDTYLDPAQFIDFKEQ